ncbi:MAG TPA: OsmC family protein [Candidatus Syntrophosphaera sp.]|jgi:putative redox protein|nr:OsmC family protein [Candidatus Syntrophosphaera sp.]
MSVRTTTDWIGQMTFAAEVNGHKLVMDVDPEWGGADQGPRPKPLLLAALSGCSGMDVVPLLAKMRVEQYKLRIIVEADSTSEHPVIYRDIRMDFHFSGENLPSDKLLKAVNLSTVRYCGVGAMLKKAADITVRVFNNDQEVKP